MPVSRDMLLSELRELLRLTAFEQSVATVRRAQAANTPIAQELAANARRSGERLALLGQAVRQVGGVPDLVAPLVGRVGAFVQAQVNQVQTLQGALLGDLALEHQLRDRARYARTLATNLGETAVLPVLDRLEAAHGETIAWLEERLDEVARTGTSALRPTPVQVAVGGARKLAAAPFALAAAGVNRVAGLVTRGASALPEVAEEAASTARSATADVIDLTTTAAERAAAAASSAGSAAADTAASVTEQVADTASSVADTATDTVSSVAETAAETVSSAADTAADTVSSAADSAAGTAGQVASLAVEGADSAADAARAAAGTAADTAAQAADSAADTVSSAADTAADAAATAAEITHEVLAETGGDDVREDKAPFPGYERLTGDSIMRHVADTEDVDELRTLLAFEQAHKARKGVLKAAQERLTELSASV